MTTAAMKPAAPPVRGAMLPAWFGWRAAAPLLLWLLLFAWGMLFGVPAGLEKTPNAWFYFAVFAAVILGLILEPIPAPAIGLIGVIFAAIARYVTYDPSASVTWALSGFQDRTVWLIFGAFVFSIGYAKTGLGRRIALALVQLLGRRTLGLGYAIALADLALAPGMPSNTGRSAGTIYPIINNIPALYGSEPGPSSRKIGSYLMWTAFAATAVTSSMFITALAPNAAALTIVTQQTKLTVEWVQWFLGFLPVGIVLFLLVPLIVYWLYPPEVKASDEVPAWARSELAKMGKVSTKEWTMAGLVLLALFLWIVGSNKDITVPFLGKQFVDATGVVLLGVGLMLLTKIVSWEDIAGNKGAWNVLVWFATLVTLAAGLQQVGFVRWIADIAVKPLVGLDPIVAMVLLVMLFFGIHYMFASLSAHTAAVLPVVLAIGMKIPGIPVLPFALLLVYSLGLMGIITPYATGPAPIYYASGYVSRKHFWLLGLAFGAIYLAALLIIGVPYLTNFMPK